ncbi:MAG: type II toxin-antitoxin system prevent-host-death family antitoxin [Caldiserica bacterium]|nr:MAG: type II toxin-antitoxin system prevent-host-death family antitoxin [Caldisericota bacterium]
MLGVIFATKLKNTLPEVLKKVEKGESYIVIRKGKPSAVLLNIEEYESLVETVRFLTNKEFLKDYLKRHEKD